MIFVSFKEVRTIKTLINLTVVMNTDKLTLISNLSLMIETLVQMPEKILPQLRTNEERSGKILSSLRKNPSDYRKLAVTRATGTEALIQPFT